MSAGRPYGAEVLLAPETDPGHLGRRIEEIRAELPGLSDTEVEALHAIVHDCERTAEERRDALSTRVMELFRLHSSRACFGLLYELNGPHLVHQVAARLRRYRSNADPRDVLQEVFFNVHRYPHRFDCRREDAFRLWSSTIVRNTVLKHLRSQGRVGRGEVAMEDLPEPADHQVDSPLEDAVRRESTGECHRVYVTYLHLYLEFYERLSAREKRALHLVEVECVSYREAAADLGIKLENLKMVIFRARRKIHRAMRRVFEGLPPDLRPARSPQPLGAVALATVPTAAASAEAESTSGRALAPSRRGGRGS